MNLSSFAPLACEKKRQSPKELFPLRTTLTEPQTAVVQDIDDSRVTYEDIICAINHSSETELIEITKIDISTLLLDEGARVYNSANLSIADNTPTIVTYDTERFDDGDLFSLANPSRLTAKKTVPHIITFNGSWEDSAVGYRAFEILLNGATVIARHVEEADAASKTEFEVATIYKLTVGDYVEARVYQNSGGALNLEVHAQYSAEFSMASISGPKGDKGETGPVGNTGPPGLNGSSGATGPVGGAITIGYSFSTTTTDSNPGAGKMRLDNATENLSNFIRLNLADINGKDWTNVIDEFDDSNSTIKGQIRIIKTGDPSKFLVFDVYGTDIQVGYRNIQVVNTGSSEASPFINNDLVTLLFTRTGDKGNNGSVNPIFFDGVHVIKEPGPTLVFQAAPTIISFNNVVFNDNSMFDILAPDRVTIRRKGKYLISAAATFKGGDWMHQFSMRVQRYRSDGHNYNSDLPGQVTFLQLAKPEIFDATIPNHKMFGATGYWTAHYNRPWILEIGDYLKMDLSSISTEYAGLADVGTQDIWLSVLYISEATNSYP